jgi:hypothetical protein
MKGDWPKNLQIAPCIAGDLFSVSLSLLRSLCDDRSQFPHIAHDHFLVECFDRSLTHILRDLPTKVSVTAAVTHSIGMPRGVTPLLVISVVGFIVAADKSDC